MTTGKTIALTIQTFVGKVTCLLFNMLSSSSKEQASFNFMAGVTIYSDFGAQENKVCHCFHCSPSICHEVMWLDAMILAFWMLSFKLAFLLYFIHIRRLFSSFSLSAIRMVLSTYLRLLIFLLAVLIPACDSYSPGFLMMYLACKLNKQRDNIQYFEMLDNNDLTFYWETLGKELWKEK